MIVDHTAIAHHDASRAPRRERGIVRYDHHRDAGLAIQGLE